MAQFSPFPGKMRAPFIVFESPNRMNKQRLIRMIISELNDTDSGVHAHRFKVPGGCASRGDRLLQAYLACQISLSPEVAHHLFSAERWRANYEIQNDLENGVMVFMERHVASGRVFSKAYGELTDEWCSQFDSGLIKPDLVIYLESDFEADDIEKWDEPDRYETPEIQAKVQELFHEIIATEPNWIAINVTGLGVKEVFDKAYPAIKALREEFLRENKPIQYY